MYRYAALYLLTSVALAAPPSHDDAIRVDPQGGPPAGWVAVAPPSTPDELMCANWADGWRVERSGKQAVALSRAGHAQPLFSIALDDGVLWATNKGEYGGKVEWQAAGSGQRTLVTGGNPVAFLPFRDAVFVAEGLAHGVTIKTAGHTEFTGEHGKQLVKLVRSDGSWKADGALALAMVPRAALQSAEQAILLANRGVIAVNLRTMQTSELHRNDDWDGLYANSIIATDNGGYLIGLRSAVVKLAWNGARFDEQWWRPAACAQLQPADNIHCTCVPQ